MIGARALSKRYGRRQAVERAQLHRRGRPDLRAARPERRRQDLHDADAGRPVLARTPAPPGILGEPVGLGAGCCGRVGVLIDGPAFVPHLQRQGQPEAAVVGDPADLAPARPRRRAGPGRARRGDRPEGQALLDGHEAAADAGPGADAGAGRPDPRRAGQRPGPRPRSAPCASTWPAWRPKRSAPCWSPATSWPRCSSWPRTSSCMNHGRLVTAGPLADLLGGADTYRLQVDDPSGRRPCCAGIPGVAAVTVEGDEVVVTAPGRAVPRPGPGAGHRRHRRHLGAPGRAGPWKTRS